LSQSIKKITIFVKIKVATIIHVYSFSISGRTVLRIEGLMDRLIRCKRKLSLVIFLALAANWCLLDHDLAKLFFRILRFV
jgi:hypothetical protein